MFGILGSIVGGLVARNDAKHSAQAQQNFQADMSNTAHQREVTDLKAAGLNPILSATGGSGASTPSGSSYQTENVAGHLVENINSGRQLNLNRQSVTSQIDLNTASATEKKALASESIERSKNYTVDRDLKIAQQTEIAINNLKSQAQIEATKLGMQLTTKQMAQIEAQIESLRAGISLTYEKQNTEKSIQSANYSSANEHAARTRNVEQDTNLKSNREKVETGELQSPTTNEDALTYYRAQLSRWVRALKGE